jgi:hypothetical protein
MSILGSLTREALDELHAFVREAVRTELRSRVHEDARSEWLTTDAVAAMLGTTGNAIRCRLRRGWLDGDVTRDGKRLLIRKAAVLSELERRARR